MIVAIILGQIFLKQPLSIVIVQLNYYFPEVTISFGWTTDAGYCRSLNLFGHAGALLLYTSILAFFSFKWHEQVHFNEGDETYNGRSIIRKTLKDSKA